MHSVTSLVRSITLSLKLEDTWNGSVLGIKYVSFFSATCQKHPRSDKYSERYAKKRT
jgi:hypothetical protein